MAEAATMTPQEGAIHEQLPRVHDRLELSDVRQPSELPAIRPYRPEDLPALHRVCLGTAAHGEDATGEFSDCDLPGLVYAAPYVIREPELCWVVTDAIGEVAGYVLGTRDSRDFAAWSEREWFPPLRARFPDASPDREGLEAELVRALHAGYRAPSFATEYPAHLHIDLLPSVQKRGWGRRLLQVFFHALRERGVPGVHLGVDNANPGAHAFYARMGFMVLQRHPSWTEMGMGL